MSQSSEELRLAAFSGRGPTPAELYIIGLLQDQKKQLNNIHGQVTELTTVVGRISTRIDNLTITVNVNPCPCPDPVPPVDPASPAPGAPSLHFNEGDSVIMIRIPVTLPDMPVNANGVPDKTLTLYSQETGGEIKSQDFTVGGGSASIDVADGSSGEAWCKSVDAAGNATGESVHATWTNAADGQASPAPAAPALGAGDEAPAVGLPRLGTMKKVK